MSERDPFDDAKTLPVVRKVARPSSSAGFSLAAIDGPDRGQTFALDGTRPRVLVGQSPACELRLADREVSRRHAALEVVGDELSLVDLGSTNGTFVNGVRIEGAFLRGGELIRVGASTLRVDRSAGSASEVPVSTGFGRMVGESLEMRKLYPLCARLAQATVPVVIEGETGTGKEVLAESLHEMGPRAAGPFVVFDCTAVPPNLLEAALFGHERGAFTGATEAKKGVFEEAHGGTLLIDEIGDLDLALQAKLLRALERSEVKRLGGSRFVRVDVRVLAATRRDLDREVAAGRFRDDLFFRLAVARIELPPLRRRIGDVAVLARHFWAGLTGGREPMPEEFLEKLVAYSWPGNVRELANAVARRVALGDLADEAPSSRGVGIAPTSVPGDDYLESTLALDLPFPQARDRVTAELERRYVERVLARHGGNVAAAAAASGIARRYFQLIRARTRR